MGEKQLLHVKEAVRHTEPIRPGQRAGCVHPADSQSPRQLLLGPPPHRRAGGWKERVKVGAVEQPSTSMYVAAEASVPNQIIIKLNQNNANIQHRLILKTHCLFLLIPSAKPVTPGKVAQLRGILMRTTEGKKPLGQLDLCRQQESIKAGARALNLYPRDTCAVPSSTTHTFESSEKDAEVANCTSKAW